MTELTGVKRRDVLRGSAATVGLLAGGGFLAACADESSSSGSSDGPRSKSQKGVLTVGLAGATFQSLDMLGNMKTNAHAIYRLLFEPLVVVDPTSRGELVPGLATSWKQIDEVTWEFAIRDGVKFHNGEALDAECAVASIKVAQGDPKNFLHARVGDFKTVTAVDARTLRVVTTQPNALTPANISQIPIYPREYYKSAGPEGFTLKPIGSGPFKFVSWPSQVDVTLDRFDGYWGEPSKYRTAVFKPINDPATRLASLLAGEIDLAYNLNLDDKKVIQGRGFKAVSSPVGQGAGINLLHLGSQPKDTPVANKQVRQALNYAVDKDAIVKNLLLGSTEVLRGQVLGSDCFGFDSSLEPYPYDPAKARELLAEAGYPDGFSIDLQVCPSNYAKAGEVSQSVAAQLEKVGVRAKIQQLELNVFLDKLVNATSSPMLYVGWNYYPVLDANFALQNFLGASALKLFDNERFDALFAAQTAESDEDKRLDGIHECLAIMRDEAPMIFLHQSPLLYGVNPRVKGFQRTSDNVPDVRLVTLQE
jgi:peptide/nickel transport system substrate-binding protein